MSSRSPTPPSGPLPHSNGAAWFVKPAAVLVLSSAAWWLCVVALTMYLQRTVASEYASSARTSTDGDSIGLPVGVFVVVTAPIWLSFNLVVIVRAFRDRHRRAREEAA